MLQRRLIREHGWERKKPDSHPRLLFLVKKGLSMQKNRKLCLVINGTQSFKKRVLTIKKGVLSLENRASLNRDEEFIGRK